MAYTHPLESNNYGNQQKFMHKRSAILKLTHNKVHKTIKKVYQKVRYKMKLLNFLLKTK